MKEEHGLFLMAGLFIGILFLAFIFWVTSSVGIYPIWSNEEGLGSFVAEKYNHTEDECVEWDYHISNLKELDSFCSQFPAYNMEYCKILFNPRMSLEKCSQYCHTKEVQVGRECKNSYFYEWQCENIVEYTNGFSMRYNITGGGDFWDHDDYSPYQTGLAGYAYSFPFRIWDNGVLVLGYESVVDCFILGETIDETTCSAVYEEQTYGCQDGRDVREARGLVG